MRATLFSMPFPAFASVLTAAALVLTLATQAEALTPSTDLASDRTRLGGSVATSYAGAPATSTPLVPAVAAPAGAKAWYVPAAPIDWDGVGQASDAPTTSTVEQPAAAPAAAPGPRTTGSRATERLALGTGAITAAAATSRILALQQHLAWIGSSGVALTGTLDAATGDAVRRFQAKHELAVTGRADAHTVSALARVARRGAQLDPRCTSVPVAVCVDKTQKVLRYVENGVVLRTLDANFGPEKGEKGFGTYSRTREGSFTVYRRHRDHVSTGYGTPMRFSLFFDGAEAMHYSDYFRRGGYAIRSFGCVDIGSLAGAEWVFEHSPIGTPFIVYH